jgi:predicted transcriptional regulator
VNEFKKVCTESLATIDEIQRPDSEENVDIYSPALEVMTDFSATRPLMIEQNTGILAAKELMQKIHVRLMLVIDSQESFKGVISLADLSSVKVMQSRAGTGLGVNELTVAELMTPRDALHAIDIQKVHRSNIGDIVSTMKAFGDQHMLVLDSRHSRIRGIISTTDISRRLHVSVDISERANSFSDIVRAVRG